MSRTHCVVDSPLGELTLVATEGVLSGLYLAAQRHRPAAATFGHRDDARFEVVAAQLREYFDGERTVFDVELAPRGTPFQRRVWEALLTIPYGQTLSYGELARRMGADNASRAVGLANGRNPISVIVPCHRVVGADGSLTGYGGGLERKRWLLDLETRRREFANPASAARVDSAPR